MRARLVGLGAAVALLATACGGGGSAQTNAASGTAIESYDVPDLGFAIDHPVGWLVVTEDAVTVFAETEAALDAAYAGDGSPATALTIVLDHRALGFMREIGFDAEPATAGALFEFNEVNFGWTLLDDPTDVEAFGVPAVGARVVTEVGVSDVIQGILPESDEIFLLELAGPDEEALDAFGPTWELVLGSIAPIE